MLRWNPDELMDQMYYAKLFQERHPLGQGKSVEELAEVMTRQSEKVNDEVLCGAIGEKEKNSYQWADIIAKTDIPAISDKYGEWDGERAICVGAGPSAYSTRSIKTMAKAVFDGYKIVCCDKISNYLYQNGIRPDYIVSVDINAMISGYMNCYPDDAKTVVCTHQRIDDILPINGKKFMMSTASPSYKLSRELFHGGIIPKKYFATRCGFSVMYSLIDFTYFMGASKIIAIGMEFYWKRKSQIHRGYFDTGQVVPVSLDIYPGYGYTTNGFILSSMVMSEYPYLVDNVELVDCSWGLVVNWKKMAFSEAVKNGENTIQEERRKSG